MAVPLSMRQVESEPQAARRFVSGANKPIVKGPTLDEALSSLFGTVPGQPAQTGQTSGKQGLLPKAALDQARAQLADAQKAIDSLKRLLANPAQKARFAWVARAAVTMRLCGSTSAFHGHPRCRCNPRAVRRATPLTVI